MSAPTLEARFRVEGMDCASCARNVEGAVSRLPGVTEYSLNFSAEQMRVRFDPAQTGFEDFKRAIEPLGYKLQALTAPGLEPKQPEADHRDHAADKDHDHAEETASGQPWWNTRSGRPVLLSGALLLVAWAFGRLEPELAQWGYIAATLVGGWGFAVKAVRGARVGNPWSINTLMSLAAIGAVLIGEAPEAATVVFLFAVGELLEGVAAGRARAGIRALAALQPRTAFLLHGEDTPSGDTHDHNAHEHEVSADSLEIGQVVRVKPGGRVPADGVILEGLSALDDSPVTGESIPVSKQPGDSVYAGSINRDGVITVRVTRTASDNTVARIVRLVEEAESAKAPTARFIDRFSKVYTPLVMLISGLVILVPPLLLGGAWHEWIYKGLSLLLIGCPCALLISVPAAITSSISSAARQGVLVKGGAILEAMSTVKTVAFDKTGTLTAGQPRVTDVVALNGDESRLLQLAAGVESGSSHPLAAAILARAGSLGLKLPAAQNAAAIPGKAVTAELNGTRYAVGSPSYAASLSALPEAFAARIAALETSGKTVVVVLEADAPQGLIAIRDEARPDAREAIHHLTALGVKALMLTGDNARTGAAIAAELGLEAHSQLLPEDKLRFVTSLRANGGIAFVGDGINDAPALASADVGVAMGSGTEVALETADAALLGNHVSGIVGLLRLARATMGNIRQNIGIALGLKLLFLVTTLLGVTSLWMAILADTGATVLVTANALRLLGYNVRR